MKNKNDCSQFFIRPQPLFPPSPLKTISDGALIAARAAIKGPFFSSSTKKNAKPATSADGANSPSSTVAELAPSDGKIRFKKEILY